MRVPLLTGRTFTEQDNLPKRDFVIIDDLLARKAFGGQAAVGQRILIRAPTATRMGRGHWSDPASAGGLR